MLLTALVACTFTEVPPHEAEAPSILEAGLHMDWEGVASRSATLAREVEGLDATDAARWKGVQDAATALTNVQKKSEFAESYGDLVASCAGCHTGQALEWSLPDGHGGGFAALQRSVVVGDVTLAAEGAERWRTSPDLGPNQPRFLDLAAKIGARVDQPDSAGRFVGKTVLECFGCHGSFVP